ncbi:DUF2244 domain-containing protein [Pontivivens insulae]|uniref:DUF2244 domain-containing protein n=1 Tax=Pontivivens insulae TaxID=1639689 RepID=A0A2R8ABV4_9RHOB|nr:DUF2244 domain-containing protein [Pontivivens insulae]RED11287.1 putative membrane protein [Pontivivens insulae]SPF29540.1 hypothetical protein POI8812_01852 [Pontivivens insulae]
MQDTAPSQDIPQTEPVLSLTLWPNRSLTREGFSIMSWIIGLGLAIPILPFLGTSVIWGLAPFGLGAFFLFRHMIHRNNRDGELREIVRLWPDLIRVDRIEPDGRERSWQANPYWVELRLHDDAKIENYLTLKGAGREIELGAFLSAEERVALRNDLEKALRDVC